MFLTMGKEMKEESRATTASAATVVASTTKGAREAKRSMAGSVREGRWFGNFLKYIWTSVAA
jgi:hypothetical protein